MCHTAFASGVVLPNITHLVKAFSDLFDRTSPFDFSETVAHQLKIQQKFPNLKHLYLYQFMNSSFPRQERLLLEVLRVHLKCKVTLVWDDEFAERQCVYRKMLWD